MAYKELITSTNCEFIYKCPLKWDSFTTTSDINIRFCDTCNQNVHKVTTKAEFDSFAKEGACVFVQMVKEKSKGLPWKKPEEPTVDFEEEMGLPY